MVIQRDTYLQRLIRSKHDGMIKVITGLRRSGKTFLLFELFYQHLIATGVDPNHIIKFAFDSQDYLNLIGEDLHNIGSKKKVNPQKFDDYIHSLIKDDGMYYILLDEIQLLGSFEAVLNGYIRIQNFDVYVTGSHAKYLSKDVITEFRGRGWSIPINPLSFKEFFDVFDKPKDETYSEYALFGGLPELLNLPAETDKARYLNDLFEEAYCKGMMERYRIVNMEEFHALLDVLSSSIGTLLNPRKLSNSLASSRHINIHPDTIRRYIDYFVDSFLISIPKLYDINRNRYLKSPLKYYFTDIGIRNTRVNFLQLEQPQIIENLIYNELMKRGYDVDVGMVALYEKNMQGKSVLKKTEINFVCNQADKRYYIQFVYSFAYEEGIAQKLKSLLHIHDAFKKIIIVKDSFFSHYNVNGVYFMSLYDFLLKKNCFDF